MEITINKDKDFYRIFPNDDACRKYLELKRWNNKPTCPNCSNNENNYVMKTRILYKCRCCRKQFSILQGTIFQGTKVPLEDWFYAIFLFVTSERGIASTTLARKINVQQRTAWIMLQKIRETMKDECSQKVLSGIVECDEAYFGSAPGRDLRLQKRMKEYKTKHNKQYEHLKAVIGIIDRYNKQIVLRKFGWRRNCLSNKIANYLLMKHVNTISTINTDEHKGYSRLYKHFHSHHVIQKERIYTRTRKNKTTYEVSIQGYVDGSKHVNGIENVWNHLKKMEKGVYFHFSYKHTHRYLDEFAYRWNRKRMGFLTGQLLEDSIQNTFGKTITYKQLIRWNRKYQSQPWKY